MSESSRFERIALLYANHAGKFTGTFFVIWLIGLIFVNLPLAITGSIGVVICVVLNLSIAFYLWSKLYPGGLA